MELVNNFVQKQPVLEPKLTAAYGRCTNRDHMQNGEQQSKNIWRLLGFSARKFRVNIVLLDSNCRYVIFCFFI